MKNILSVLILLFSQSVIWAQQSVTYFNEEWEEISDASEAVYYRTVEKKGDKFEVRDIFMDNNQPQMIAECSSIEPDLVYDGSVKWFYENGNRKMEKTYKNNKVVGENRFYYPSGKQRAVIIYTDSEMSVNQHWDEDGTPNLVDGNGFIIDSLDYNLPFNTFTEVRDHKPKASYGIKGIERDTLYTIADSTPEFIGGMEAFYKSISKKISYPKAARKNKIEGRVFIGFVVDKKGQVVNATVFRGIGGGCDEEALRVVKESKGWKPAMYNGKQVPMQLVLPITFRL